MKTDRKKRILVISAAVLLLILILITPLPFRSAADSSVLYRSLTYTSASWRRDLGDGGVFERNTLFLLPRSYKSEDELWELTEAKTVIYDSAKTLTLEITDSSHTDKEAAANASFLAADNNGKTFRVIYSYMDYIASSVRNGREINVTYTVITASAEYGASLSVPVIIAADIEISD